MNKWLVQTMACLHFGTVFVLPAYLCMHACGDVSCHSECMWVYTGSLLQVLIICKGYRCMGKGLPHQLINFSLKMILETLTKALSLFTTV